MTPPYGVRSGNRVGGRQIAAPFPTAPVGMAIGHPPIPLRTPSAPHIGELSAQLTEGLSYLENRNSKGDH